MISLEGRLGVTIEADAHRRDDYRDTSLVDGVCGKQPRYIYDAIEDAEWHIKQGSSVAKATELAIERRHLFGEDEQRFRECIKKMTDRPVEDMLADLLAMFR